MLSTKKKKIAIDFRNAPVVAVYCKVRHHTILVQPLRGGDYKTSLDVAANVKTSTRSITRAHPSGTSVVTY
jgi:hypothetical protein